MTSSPTSDVTGLPVTSSPSPNFTWSDEDLFRWHGTELIVIPIMMFLGIVGNLFVFYIYYFRWESNTVTLVKRMLAGIDLTFLFLSMPLVLHLVINPRTPDFLPMCRFLSFVALASAQCSGFVLIIIAVDRFLRLRLMRKSGISSIQSKKLFLASIVGGVALNLPTCWIFGRDVIDFYNYSVKTSYCFIAQDKNEVLFSAWSFTLGVAFVIKTTTLVVLYSKIILTLRELSKKRDELKRRPSLAAGSELIQKDKQSKLMRSTSLVFTAITFVYFSSYAPYFAVLVLSMADPTIEGSMGPKLKVLYDLCKLSPLANNVANPLIYSLSSPRFRAELKKLVTLKTFKKGFFRRRAFSVASRSYDWELSQASSSTRDTKT